MFSKNVVAYLFSIFHFYFINIECLDMEVHRYVVTKGWYIKYTIVHLIKRYVKFLEVHAIKIAHITVILIAIPFYKAVISSTMGISIQIYFFQAVIFSSSILKNFEQKEALHTELRAICGAHISNTRQGNLLTRYILNVIFDIQKWH